MRLRPIAFAPFLTALIGCTGPRYDDPILAEASENWHAQIVEAFEGYGRTTDTKVLAVCIAWPDSTDEKLDLVTGGWFYTGQGSDIQIFTGDLSKGAMDLCRKNAAESERDCTCQFVDKNGKNVLTIPDDVAALLKQ